MEMLLPNDLLTLLEALVGAGHAAYVVGGAVRDTVLGRLPKDYDVATSAHPDVAASIVRRLGWRVDEVGRAFGVLRVRGPGEGWEYEVATFRSDVGHGRRPSSVVFSTIDEDVARRDFTINALFYDHRHGRIVDKVGGVDDIRRRIVRTVGRPIDRISEDRLRIMRAVRFASVLGFELDDELREAILLDPSLHDVSPERTRDELQRSVEHAVDPCRTLRILDGLRLWDAVLPGLPVLLQEPAGDACGLTLCSALAMLLNAAPSPRAVGQRLMELRYTLRESQRVEILLNLGRMHDAAAPSLRRSCRIAGIGADDVSRHAALMGWSGVAGFARYLDERPIPAQPLVDAGYSGPDLGRELARQEVELYAALRARVEAGG